MSFVIHGNPISTCTRRVLVVAAQAGVWENITVDTCQLGDIKTPEWLEHQPFAQMPYLEDTEAGFEMFESRAMAKYIATKSKSGLIPSPLDVEAYAKFEQACSVEQAQFDPSASTLTMELLFKKWRGIEADHGIVEVQKVKLANSLNGYERILSKTRYIAGDQLTAADLFHLPYGSFVVELGVAPGLVDGSLPNVTRWWKELSELPSWAKANQSVKHEN